VGHSQAIGCGTMRRRVKAQKLGACCSETVTVNCIYVFEIESSSIGT
jgi:hypothetical protein